jgi:tetratricopeptide (TPR) repeat protein
MTPSPDVVTDRQLDHFLDRIEADLEEDDSDKADSVLAALRAQPLRAHSIDAIARLLALWLYAGDALAARAMLDADGASILASEAPDARPDTRMRLALYRLQIAISLREDDAIGQALAQVRRIIADEPGLHADRYRRWGALSHLELHHPAHALAAIDVRHALCVASPERAALRAQDEAERQRRRAWVFKRQGANADAVRAADAALAAMADAAPGQSVDEQAWLRLGDSLIGMTPHGYPVIERGVAKAIADWPPARRRELEVRLARLGARAAYAQDGPEAALAACELARHSLAADGTDDFIEFELRWLIEAGRFDEAGQRVFFHIYECEEQTWAGMAQIVHERLADESDTSVWWLLSVMLACDTAHLLERLIANGRAATNIKLRSTAHAELFAAVGEARGDELREAVHAAARSLAQRRAPDHPWLAFLSALHDGRAKLIDPATQAERLRAAIEQGGMTDDRSHYALFVARQQSAGLAAAIEFPPPELASGRACYRFAAGLDEEDAAFLQTVPEPSRADMSDELDRLKLAIYEQGLAYMERFLETGKGHPNDGCAELYAMLCNNLGLGYKDAERYAEAIELHRRGIAASPFADQYASLMNALRASGDHAAAIDMAEQLWHFSMERGFGGYSPNWYVRNIVKSLEALGRGDEILIWLERLVTWQRQVARLDEAKLPQDALGARVIIAMHLALTRPGEAASLWASLQPQVAVSENPWTAWNAATLLHDLGRYDEAKTWYERVLALNEARPEHERLDTASIERQLVSYRDGAEYQSPREPARKRWWRLWR